LRRDVPIVARLPILIDGDPDPKPFGAASIPIVHGRDLQDSHVEGKTKKPLRMRTKTLDIRPAV
jgi:hypothetical protein